MMGLSTEQPEQGGDELRDLVFLALGEVQGSDEGLLKHVHSVGPGKVL